MADHRAERGTPRSTAKDHKPRHGVRPELPKDVEGHSFGTRSGSPQFTETVKKTGFLGRLKGK